MGYSDLMIFRLISISSDKIKTFSNISKEHLAQAMQIPIDDLTDEFGEHLAATKAKGLDRSASYSPRSSSKKPTLEECIALDGKVNAQAVN